MEKVSVEEIWLRRGNRNRDYATQEAILMVLLRLQQIPFGQVNKKEKTEQTRSQHLSLELALLRDNQTVPQRADFPETDFWPAPSLGVPSGLPVTRDSP
jgi:hypothetical protein